MNIGLKYLISRHTRICFAVLVLFSSSELNAQFLDNFSDGDYTGNPAWTGSTDNFIVNGSGQLQLNDTDPVVTQSSLHTSNVLATLQNKEWRMHVKHTLSGSDSNQARIYIVADAEPLSYTGTGSAGVHGYFLKLGEALSGDVVRLYRDDATDITLIGSTTTSIANSFEIGIRIITDNSGNWTVSIDPAGGVNYQQEASVNDNTYNTSSHFGVICTYTSSNTTKFYYDDFFAGDIEVDTTPPSLISATATSNTTVDALFSEALELSSAETLSNYSVVGIGTPVAATLDDTNPSIVHLEFSASFNLNQTYTLDADQIADVAGNEMTPSQTANFLWFEAQIAGYRDVVFNEILADPTPVVALPDAEFVELYNAHPTSSFDLEDWSFINSTTIKILPQHILEPGGHVILCDAGDVSLFSGFGDVIGIASFTALSNSGDSLTLLNSDEQIIDVVVYSDTWFDSPEKLDGGWTLELINPILPCQTASNWHECENASGGTPGSQNSVFDLTQDSTAPVVELLTVSSANEIVLTFSETMDTTGYSIPSWSVIPFNSIADATWNGTLDEVILTLQQNLSAPNTYTITIDNIQDCSGNSISTINIDFTIGFLPAPGDIIINEIMADPDPQIGMPAAEYIEIRNNTPTLIDVTGVHLNSGEFSTQTFIQPDSFIIVADEDDASYFTNIPEAVFMSSFPSLTNSGMTLTMSDQDDNTLDEVNYNTTWYHDDSKADGGWSLERINPLAICSGGYNWTASENQAGGTAGIENSVFSTAPNGSPYVTGHGALSDTQIYIRFSESMDVTTVANMSADLVPFNTVQTPAWNSDRDQVIFTTSIALTPGQNYVLTITGLTDCDANAVSPSTLDFIIGTEPEPGDIIINEILSDGMSDDIVASPKFDFIELYNRSNHILELSQINVNNGFFEEQVTILPDSFIVVTDVDNDHLAFFAYPNTYYMTDFPLLTEDGTEITVSGNNGILDEVIYNKSYYHDPDKEDGGYSMERINPEDPCSSSDNWHACMNSNGTSAGKRNSVYDTTADTNGPTLVYILGSPQESITLVFNEPIDEASLSGISWTVNSEVQTGINPVITGNENNEVVLYYGEMESGVIYQFELTGIEDCWGNDAGLITGKFGLAVPVIEGDIIINEVLYNPFENGNDFIEIYNNSTKIVSLRDWRISDATGGVMNTPDIISEVDYLFFPGDYLALGKQTSTLVEFYPATSVLRTWDVTGFADFSSEDVVFILTPDGTIHDQFSYNSEFQYPLLNTDDGVSLERISFNRPTSDNTNWHSAAETAGFATPGYVNSQSEMSMGTDDQFKVETEIFSPDNDGNKDVATFSYNLSEPGYTGDIRIYDSEGRFVRHLMKSDLLGASGSISWDGLSDEKQKASIGIYIVMFEAFTPGGSTVRSKKTCVLAHNLN